ncbi:MAG: type II toxin-antitoxin system VapC family toxin [Gemmatimonadota bacterium]
MRLALGTVGQPIGERDLIIAATALAHGCDVATGNLREFTRVPGLRVEAWG